jgi:hypothetical protein
MPTLLLRAALYKSRAEPYAPTKASCGGSGEIQMSATVAEAVPEHLEEADSPPHAHVGGVSFSDLVRAHFKRERERKHGDTEAAQQAEQEFQGRLLEFQAQEGALAAAYWSTRNASAIAMTVGSPRGRRNPLIDTENEVRLHRVTDWVTRDAEPVADILHACDLLAIRVGEILRGTSARIAMRWLYAVQEHVLGYLERTPAHASDQEHELIAAQRRELARIEDYYLRAGAKAGRIVYATGMLIGATMIAAACSIVAIVLTHGAHHWNHDVRVLLLCTGAGAAGALVSVLSRMSGGTDKFSVDFEVGRPLLRRLGLYKPLVGSVFGLALYFLLVSGILMTKAPSERTTIYFYAIVAFLAGFSERFTGVMFGDAERLLSGDGEQPAAAAK